MRNSSKKNSVLGLSLLGVATVCLMPLASCASTGIADLYMSQDSDGARIQSVFFAGEPVNCILKMNSGRLDETLLVSYRPLEANGDVLDLPAQLVSNSAPGKTSGVVATPFPAPAVVAFTNPALAMNPGLLVTHADTTDDSNDQIRLMDEIRAKMIAHFLDGNVHKIPDMSGMTLGPDALGTAQALTETEQLKNLFATHVGSTNFHDFADTRDVLTAPAPDAMLFLSMDMVVRATAFTTFSTELNEFKAKLNAHISTIVQSPGQTAGKYRCEVQLADEKKSVDFVILPGGIPEPPPNSVTPRVGMCNGDPVANCPDPIMKGPNMLKCCTIDNACGSGPKGTPFCY